MFLKSVVLLALPAAFGGVQSAPTPSTTTNSINWFRCDQNATWPVTCGTLAVPLDYTDKASSESLDLKLLKFNATKEPVKGSILFNPGGPGAVTREFLAGYATQMLMYGHIRLPSPESKTNT